MDHSVNTLSTQVVIIGAGPTGLSMAVQLIRHNIDFIIIDKNSTTTALSKAIVVHARTLEIFKESGLAEKATAAGQQAAMLNLMRNGKIKAQVNVGALGKGLSEFPYVLSLEQSKTEKLLYDYILQSGKKVLWESEFITLQEDEKIVTVSYKDTNGAEQKIEAQYLVGCDGAHSAVRRQLGLSFEGDTEPKLFYVADVFIKSSVINNNEFYFFITKGGFILFFSMEGTGHYRIVGILPGAGNTDRHFEFKDIEQSIKEEVECPLEFTELKWFSTYRIHSRKANSFSAGRCFICGDAGHIHTPAGGQGMNTGIQDTYNLAWKLAYSIKGFTGKAVLQTYNAERTENAAHLLKTTDKMFDIMAGTTGFWNFFRQHILPVAAKFVFSSSFGKKKLFPLVSQTGIAYPHSYLTEKSSVGKIKAGDRMPYFTIAGRSVYDHLAEPVFKILYIGDSESKDGAKTNVPCITHSIKEVPAALFGNEKDFYILLRPDNHIAYIGTDINKCRSYFDKISSK